MTEFELWFHKLPILLFFFMELDKKTFDYLPTPFPEKLGSGYGKQTVILHQRDMES